MYCTAPLSPRKGRLKSFRDDDDDDDDDDTSHLRVPRLVEVVDGGYHSTVVVGVINVSPIATTLTRVTGQHHLTAKVDR